MKSSPLTPGIVRKNWKSGTFTASESESDVESESSCESEHVPLGPPRCRFSIEFELTTLYENPLEAMNEMDNNFSYFAISEIKLCQP